MRALFITVAWQSAVIVATLLVGATAVLLWWEEDRAERHDRDQRAAIVAAVVSVTTEIDTLRTVLTRASPAGLLAVHLANGHRVGPSRAATSEVLATARLDQARTVDVEGGRSYLLPVVAADGGTVIIEVHQPDQGVDRHVVTVLAVFVMLSVVGVALAVSTAQRRSTPVVTELRALADAANTSTVTELTWQPSRRTPVELVAIAAMINRVGALARALVERERKMIADVSHRLRTPLTPLRLDVETIGGGPTADRIRNAVVALEHVVGEIIKAAGRPSEPVAPAEPMPARCDLSAVVRQRMQFWQILADNQSRRCELDLPEGPSLVPVDRQDMADIVNELLTNVFRHTASGTPMAVSVGHHAGWVSLVVDDGGPGFADPEAAVQRGVSGGDSTGLGLDIVRTKVEAVGGVIHVERGKLDGARIRLRFPEISGAPELPFSDQHDRPIPR